MMRELFGVDLEAARERYVFFGDSPNDAPMFGFFPNAVGVANVRDFADRMDAPAALDHHGALGAGFVELAQRADRGAAADEASPAAGGRDLRHGRPAVRHRTALGQAILTAAGAKPGARSGRRLTTGRSAGARAANIAFLSATTARTIRSTSLIATWGRHFRVLAESRPALKPGATELLDLLDELGLPRAIATSSRIDGPSATWPRMAWRTVSTTCWRGDYGNGKPAPDPFLKAAERLGVAPALCLALEDSHNGVRSASAAGMMAVMVPDLIPATDEIQGLCTHVVVDLHDVCRMLGVRR